MYQPITYAGTANLRSLYEGRSSVIRIRVATKWEAFDFGSTSRTRSVDMIIVDEEGYELHATIPEKLIWKFNDNIQEGCIYFIEGLHLGKSKSRFKPTQGDNRGFFRQSTSVTALGTHGMLTLPRNFNFTEFEKIGANTQNIHLTDVVGYLKTCTKLQRLNNEIGNTNMKREIVLENLSGSSLKITLWGAAADQVVQNSVFPNNIINPNLVAVCSTYVKNYQGNITLSSTNSTRLYYNLDPRYIIKMRQRLLNFRQQHPITTVGRTDIASSENAGTTSVSQIPNSGASKWSSNWKAKTRNSSFYMFQKDMTKNVKIGFFRTVGRELARVLMNSIIG